MKPIIDPTQNLIPSNKVSTIHHPNVRRHFESKTKQKKKKPLFLIGKPDAMQCDKR